MVFNAINWTRSEMIGEPKMDMLAENARHLHVNSPRVLYVLPGGGVRQEGIKIAGGRVVIPRNTQSDTATAQVRFGNFFSFRCEPIVTTGIMSEGQVKIFAVASGIGQHLPDHRGFNVKITIAADNKQNDHIAKSFYIAWQAIGY